MTAEGLTKAEREAIDLLIRDHLLVDDDRVVYEAVERILADRLAAVQAEAERLRRRKAEASTLFGGMQDLGRALDLPLGVLITGPVAIEAAERLRTRAESAEAERDALRERVEALADEWLGSVQRDGYDCAMTLRAALDADRRTDPSAGSERA